jgi:hypothetical protein
MPEEANATGTSTPPGWVAGLPDPLKSNEAITKFKTVGEFANDYLAVSTKASELEKKMGDYIPKLPQDATDEERSLYLDALGRPKQPSEYKFEGEDKNAPEWNDSVKKAFHSAGLTASQADQIGKWWNGQMKQMVEAHNTTIKNEMAAAETKLKSEWGNKFDTNMELAKRMWNTHGEGDFDKAFDAATSPQKIGFIKALVKFASLTGEDKSPQSAQRPTVNGVDNPYPKSNMPAARSVSWVAPQS